MKKKILSSNQSVFPEPRKHWLLEDGPSDTEGGFINTRNGPFQSSLNERKHKVRQKKPGLLRGIGHMFRFGKHRKDGIAPSETNSEFGISAAATNNVIINPADSIKFQTLPQPPSSSTSVHQHQNGGDRKSSVGGPPLYQPPPPVSNSPSNGGIHKNDLFNHRYSHYVNYDELQQQIRYFL